MLAQVRSWIADSKRMTTITEGLGGLFTRAEEAGGSRLPPPSSATTTETIRGSRSSKRGTRRHRGECEALVGVRSRMVDVEDLAGKYTSGGIHAIAWKAFMFKSHRFIEPNCALAPRTAALLRNVPGLYTAFFSVLEGGQYITPHWGYWKGSSRYHLGVHHPGQQR